MHRLLESLLHVIQSIITGGKLLGHNLFYYEKYSQLILFKVSESIATLYLRITPGHCRATIMRGN